ncbi:contractile injection system protein, VgrG/Pvc8 family [Oxalobacter vibrioformis]|uniref:Contractile injection system protein, VgrG/Pvc8 family n=1 Tax=Oxalobacter vibrioformis TaxID=933080 RepID=A0A9E9LXG8_9BURK|nr:contractile injection system protein, VgrG/Pvc8 family [Oxalobacter vibrioformis]WAW09277.1 contractile injection system protein, VgrG/Pvc8 family [Oxalobacter vibrioformis]
MATPFSFVDESRNLQAVPDELSTPPIKETPVKPSYRLVANNQDITDLIRDRFISLRYTDAVGFESDVLEIELSDHIEAEPIELPPTGAELQLYLGYDDVADLKGIFIVDELNLGRGTSRPGRMAIRARATPFDRSKGGKSTLQSQKRRIWKKGTRIGDMVATIATEHGMEYAVSASLLKVPLPTIDQSNESDINLLLRIGKKYDALVKPSGGKLIFAKRGEMKTLGGEQLPPVPLIEKDVSSWDVTLTMRDSAGLVVATWHIPKSARKHQIKVGTGEPVHRIKQLFQTEEAALAAAKAEYAKRQREGTKLTFEMTGRGDVIAEAPLQLSQWRQDVPTDWIISSVDHNLDPAGGWTMSIQAELPDDPATAKVETVTVPKKVRS